MSRYIYIGIILVIATFLLPACEKDQPGDTPKPDDGKLVSEYNPQTYEIKLPKWMPPLPTDASNPTTVDGVALGRMLFYDPVLSRDSSQSCSSCHKQSLAFTDGQTFSTGIRGELGKRNAMSIANLAYNLKGMFWDGRSNTLEAQALVPIEDHLEMDDTWENVEKKLRRSKRYPELFRKAFGISNKSEISRDLVTKSLGQFQRTIISSNSRYDKVVWGKEDFPTDEEQRGLELFFIELGRPIGHPGCSHCHFNPLFTDNNYHNNGLDKVAHLGAFKDLGRGIVTNNQFDNGKFRTPTLRNIALTAPYMHDGRFKTLEEVLDHYSKGGHGVQNEDPNIQPFPLTDQEKADLIAFLKMLTDESFVTNLSYSNPFKP